MENGKFEKSDKVIAGGLLFVVLFILAQIVRYVIKHHTGH